jgi:hypothetical protein
MDSRDYVCAFAIDSSHDVPPGFRIPTGLPELLAGVFLPQDEPAWLRGGRYPARVLLLGGGGLWVLTHPTAREPAGIVPLQAVEMLECGRMSLSGWIRLCWERLERTVRYNRRTHLPMERFLSRPRAQWLGDAAVPSRALPVGPREALPLKFNYTLETEMSHGESTLARFFQLARRRRLRRWIFRHSVWSAGDLVLLSDKRVLWITERYRSSRVPYGTISRSVPLHLVSRFRLCSIDGAPHVEILLRPEDVWRFRLNKSEEAPAATFVAAANNALAGGARAAQEA